MAAKSFSLAVSIARLALAPFFRGCEGVEHLCYSDRCLVAANHTSILDGVILVTAWAWLRLRPLHMIAYEEPFRHWLWGWFLRSSRCIPFRRGDVASASEMMRAALGYLEMGEAVGIFPEGHINRGIRLRKPRPGVALLALASGAPVLPAAMLGAREVLPLGQRRPALRRVIKVRFGAPLYFAEESAEYLRLPLVERARLVQGVLTRIMEAIGNLLDHGGQEGKNGDTDSSAGNR